MKVRKKSTDCTSARPDGTSIIAASSGESSPIETPAPGDGPSLPSTRSSTEAPTLAPQPPQRMPMSASKRLASASASAGSGGAVRRAVFMGAAGGSRYMRIHLRSI